MIISKSRDFPKIDLKEYSYVLPEKRIAQAPSNKRDGAKLLFYNKGKIQHKRFHDLPNLLDANQFLVFNTTRVVKARLFFHRKSGAQIEILLLNPIHPSTDPYLSLQSSKETIWQCMIGNKKKWKKDELIFLGPTEGQATLQASWESKDENTVKFSWTDGTHFGEIIARLGKTPLPPYIQKKLVPDDEFRYQTIYAENPGAVAAPTAGLHFSEQILKELQSNAVDSDRLFLHVGGGTFAPIKSPDASQHKMHQEYFEVSFTFLENLLNHGSKNIVPVGTTSLRVLESLFWIGMLGKSEGFNIKIDANIPYQYQEIDESWEIALEKILDHMSKNHLKTLSGETGIFIVPGYQFRVCSGLITNFHLPGTTLILLVAAFVGRDWKRIYEEAMKENYRFLSYGDSSLILG
jgi:S-adenosylmethionine:tRNA ribosyltransferase-isomerase